MSQNATSLENCGEFLFWPSFLLVPSTLAKNEAWIVPKTSCFLHNVVFAKESVDRKNFCFIIIIIIINIICFLNLYDFYLIAVLIYYLDFVICRRMQRLWKTVVSFFSGQVSCWFPQP